MNGGCPDHPGRGRPAVIGVLEHRPARTGQQRGVGQQQARGDETQLGRGLAELVADRGDDVEQPEGAQHGEGEPQAVVVLLVEPREELGRADDERHDPEPAPATPQEHADRRSERDGHEGERRGVGAGVDEDGCEQRPDDADARDDRLVPADRDRGRDRAHEPREDEREHRIDQVVELGCGRQRDVESRDRRRHRCQCRLRPALPLVQVETCDEQRGRADEGEQDAGRLVDPAAVGRHDEEEDDAEDDGCAADPAEHASAEQILDRDRRPGGLRRARRQRRRSRGGQPQAQRVAAAEGQPAVPGLGARAARCDRAPASSTSRESRGGRR